MRSPPPQGLSVCLLFPFLLHTSLLIGARATSIGCAPFCVAYSGRKRQIRPTVNGRSSRHRQRHVPPSFVSLERRRAARRPVQRELAEHVPTPTRAQHKRAINMSVAPRKARNLPLRLLSPPGTKQIERAYHHGPVLALLPCTTRVSLPLVRRLRAS